MDFKKLISHIESIDGPIETPKAPQQAAPIRLEEGTELRVLAGITPLTESVIAEKKLTGAEKKKKEEVVKSMKKDKGDFEKRYGERGEEVMHATATKIAKKKAESIGEAEDRPAAKKTSREVELPSGAKVKATKVQGWRSQKSDKESEKGKNESVELDIEEFNETFSQMVEAAKSKPDFLDIDKDGNKKEPMKKAAADKKKGAVKEASDDRAPAKKSERQATLPSGAKVKATKVQGWQSQKADKAAEKNESKMMPKGKKRPVKESVEPKLSFKDMVKLVQESGGQQQIDAKDQALFTWAQRVAKSKLGEGMKAEVYAGLVYERMGGRFEMYDVLNETIATEVGIQKKNLDPDSIDYKSLEVDGIDYRDAPEFVDAYFSDGYHVDGSPLEDWELEELSNDYDLVHQYVINKIY